MVYYNQKTVSYMKYTYAYKTSDGVRHEEAMVADSREAVFMALRQRGIKAIKVVAADGSKANGELRGVRKRVVVFSGIVMSTLVGAMVFFGMRKSGDVGVGVIVEALEDTTRRQLIGDSVVIEKGIRTGWSEIFDTEGDRFLASFAIPGVKAAQRNTSVKELEEALARHIAISEKDGIEARQIKAMVEGMKHEARRYIAAGGSAVEYGKRLTERQDAEIAIYERTKREVEVARKTMNDEEFVSFWERRNDQLRNLGIRLLSME